jgi:hypothetical protein
MSPQFQYDFSNDSDSEIGYMIQLAKRDWPTDVVQIAGRIEWLNALYDELWRRWACADDSNLFHRQGQRQ